MKVFLGFLYIFIPTFISYWIGWFVGRRFERESLKEHNNG